MAKSRRLALEPEASSGSRRSADAINKPAQFFVQFLGENQKSCYWFYSDRTGSARSYEAPGGEEKGESFFYFFRRNLLKSPDSDE
jgi:hypothetical protein